MPAKKKQRYSVTQRLTWAALAISILVNVFFAIGLVVLNDWRYDFALDHYTVNRLCERDYGKIMQSLGASNDSQHSIAKRKAFFAAAVCGIDNKTGRSLNKIDLNNYTFPQ